MDPVAGLSGSAEDCSARAARFGTNRLADRQETTFSELLLDALNVRSRHRSSLFRCFRCPHIDWGHLRSSHTIARRLHT